RPGTNCGHSAHAKPKPVQCSATCWTQLKPAGAALVCSTYLGGSGPEVGSAIAVDASGNAYVTGYTHSADFPTTPDAFQPSFVGGTCVADYAQKCADAFVTKLDPTGSTLVYSTYLGGQNNDFGMGIAVDAA